MTTLPRALSAIHLWVCNAIRFWIFRKAQTLSPLTLQKIQKTYTAILRAVAKPQTHTCKTLELWILNIQNLATLKGKVI